MEIVEYLGNWNIPSQYGFEKLERNGKVYVIITELPTNTGTSVTNAIEKIATGIYHRIFFGKVKRDKIIWIEHYPKTAFRDIESFDEVSFVWDDMEQEFKKPSWKRIRREDIYGK